MARGHVNGLARSSDRAELQGALAGLKWQRDHGCHLCLWLDNKFVADSANFLLEHLIVPSHWEHLDLWDEVLQCLLELDGKTCLIPWGPSHLRETAMEDPFEDWFRLWNNRADALAAQRNFFRPTAFQQALERSVLHAGISWKKLRQLRSFFFQVAAHQKDVEDPVNHMNIDCIDNFDFETDQVTLCMLYNDTVPAMLSDGDFQYKSFPHEFVIAIFDWLFSRRCAEPQAYCMSFLELTVAMTTMADLRFPFANKAGLMDITSLSSRFERPTFAYLYGCIRGVILSFVSHFHWDDVLFKSKSKVSLGICVPFSFGYHV